MRMLLLLVVLIGLAEAAGPIKQFGDIGWRLLSQDDANDDDECKDTTTTSVIYLAGGCFWGLELAFQRLPGIVSTRAEYCIEGNTAAQPLLPTYRTLHLTGHCEAVRVEYQPSVVALGDLLDWFLQELHDPTTLNRQGADVGTQYRSAIFPTTLDQHQQAVLALERFGSAAVTTQLSAPLAFTCHPAEEHHQQYLARRTGQSADKRDPTPIRCYG